jgi:dynein heavy chain
LVKQLDQVQHFFTS